MVSGQQLLLQLQSPDWLVHCLSEGRVTWDLILRLLRYGLQVCTRLVGAEQPDKNGEAVALTGTAELTLGHSSCPHQRSCQMQASCIEPGLESQMAVGPLLNTAVVQTVSMLRVTTCNPSLPGGTISHYFGAKLQHEALMCQVTLCNWPADCLILTTKIQSYHAFAQSVHS